MGWINARIRKWGKKADHECRKERTKHTSPQVQLTPAPSTTSTDPLASPAYLSPPLRVSHAHPGSSLILKRTGPISLLCVSPASHFGVHHTALTCSAFIGDAESSFGMGCTGRQGKEVVRVRRVDLVRDECGVRHDDRAVPLAEYLRTIIGRLGLGLTNPFDLIILLVLPVGTISKYSSSMAAIDDRS